MTLTPEQRERIINHLVNRGAYPLRDRTDEELMGILQVGEALREEIDPEYRALRNRSRKVKP